MNNERTKRRDPFNSNTSTDDIMRTYRNRDGLDTTNTAAISNSPIKKVKATFLIPEDIHYQLKLFAVKQKRKLSDIVTSAIKDYAKITDA